MLDDVLSRNRREISMPREIARHPYCKVGKSRIEHDKGHTHFGSPILRDLFLFNCKQK